MLIYTVTYDDYEGSDLLCATNDFNIAYNKHKKEKFSNLSLWDNEVNVLIEYDEEGNQWKPQNNLRDKEKVLFDRFINENKLSKN